MYLVKTNGTIKEFENFKEVKKELLIATFTWCQNDNYSGDSYKTLYKQCLKNKNFENIAQVFKVDSFFYLTDKTKIPCELYTCELHVPMTITKIM